MTSECLAMGRELDGAGPAAAAADDRWQGVVDPAPPPPDFPRDPNAAVMVKTGKMVSDISAPANKPGLPPELNIAGLTVWGLYKVC